MVGGVCVCGGGDGDGGWGGEREGEGDERRGEETPLGLDGQIQQLTRMEELAGGVVKTNDLFSRLQDTAFCAYDG